MAKSEHPAEVFLRTVAAFYPDMPRRLECACVCSHFLAHADESLAKARGMVDACNEVRVYLYVCVCVCVCLCVDSCNKVTLILAFPLITDPFSPITIFHTYTH